jgi:Putative prokaryotic signal transducing protein
MTPTRQSLVDHCGLLSDDELLDQFRSGDLTDLAQDVAATELRSRNIDFSEARSPKPSAEPEVDVKAGWSSEDLVLVARLNSVSANLLQSRLNAEGVPAIVADDFASRNIPFGVGVDGVRVLVPESYFERAAEIKKKIDRGDYALDDKADGR